MKPTYGRVPRYGVVAFASSLDQVGPLTKSVEDAAIVCEAIFGIDPHDATTIDRPSDVRRELDAGVKGLRLGVPKEYFSPAGVEPGVTKAIRAAIAQFEKLGATILDVSLPSTDKGLAVLYNLPPPEAAANLARYDGGGSG